MTCIKQAESMRLCTVHEEHSPAKLGKIGVECRSSPWLPFGDNRGGSTGFSPRGASPEDQAEHG
jgi:hypothetical protein